MELVRRIGIGMIAAAIVTLPTIWLVGVDINRPLAWIFGAKKTAIRGELPPGARVASTSAATTAAAANTKPASAADHAPQLTESTPDASLSSAAVEERPNARRRLAMKLTGDEAPTSTSADESATTPRSGAVKSVRKAGRETTTTTARNRAAAIDERSGADRINRSASDNRRPKLDRPRLTLMEQVNVPALQAGELQSINVRLGDEVTKGELLAQINDKEQQVIARKAEAERRVAQEKHEESVDIEFAEAAKKVAEAELEFHKDANKKNPGTVTPIEVMKDKLNVEKSRLQKEKAEVDKRVDGLTVDVKRADEDGAKLGIERRQILSPIEGQVVKIMRHAGEWVSPGDPVFRVIRMDRLRVEGELRVSVVDPRRISKGTPVTVTVPGLDGKPLTVSGVVTFVTKEIGAGAGGKWGSESGGEYTVVTEFDNPREGEHWMIFPGMPDPQVTILLDEPPVRSTAGAGGARDR